MMSDQQVTELERIAAAASPEVVAWLRALIRSGQLAACPCGSSAKHGFCEISMISPHIACCELGVQTVPYHGVAPVLCGEHARLILQWVVAEARLRDEERTPLAPPPPPSYRPLISDDDDNQRQGVDTFGRY